MDIEPVGKTSGRFMLAEATVARSSDLGANDRTYFTRTHLGTLLHPGDTVMGYHLSGTNFNNPNFEALESNDRYASHIPDVVLVKKSYQRTRRSHKGRNWRLKRMSKEEAVVLPKKQDQEKMDRDYERFLQDVEEDQDLRGTIALYKQKMEQQRAADALETQSMAETEEGGDAPQIDVGELLDDFEELGIHDVQE